MGLRDPEGKVLGTRERDFRGRGTRVLGEKLHLGEKWGQFGDPGS